MAVMNSNIGLFRGTCYHTKAPNGLGVTFYAMFASTISGGEVYAPWLGACC